MIAPGWFGRIIDTLRAKKCNGYVEGIKNNLDRLSFPLSTRGCHDLSSKNSKIELIKAHQSELELVVDYLLNDRCTIAAAQNFLYRNGIPLGIIDVNKQDRVISFFIDGLTDDCYGIAYSETGKQGKLCGGQIVDWENLVDKWYNLSSI
ncbi:hypothetical protein GXP67_21210 [Rhodocytophaga rosea]|uniref:Uncharacterized protein n=1 Tax=Rhodocytophaga rosea TaxID=2704465 RepID=A0A6C0GMX8_9BACT|nr:hypothetical protein [Rhodocytophaga rosea]QHT68990.1 hypothetical protein GXP67_21210 [Rhodocytophaga rosea]